MRRIRKKGSGSVGGRGRYLEIGPGRYLAIDGGGDYYISGKPQRIERGRPIEKIMFATPKEGYRCFRIDTADYYDIVAVGIIMDLDGYLWVAGDMIGEVEEVEEKKAGTIIMPPVFARYPKTTTANANVSQEQYMAQVAEATVAKATADDLRKKGYLRSDEELGVSLEQDKMRSVNQPSQQVTNNNIYIWTMETFNSSLHKPNCPGAHANIWTTEQLKSSLDNCSTGNCPHCRG